MPLVVGVDSSTQSTKVEARDVESGDVVASGVGRHPPTSPPVSEQHPDAWWTALVDAMGQLGAARHEVIAISVAGQQHGLVVLDGAGTVLRPAKLWNDTTSAPNAAALVDRLGAAAWASATGSVPVASFTITKLAWLAEHEPDVLARIARVMLPHDWLTYRLSGEHVTDRGDASGTGWFDPTAGEYREDLIAAAVGDATGWLDRLPKVLGPWEVAGRITAASADELGLPDGVVVGPGTGDNMGAALGLGLAAGDVALSLGTSGTVFAVSDTGTADERGYVAGFASAQGNFLPLICTLNATKVTDTVAAWLGTDPPGLAELALAAADDPGSSVLVPYFDGERTPNLPDARGSLHGLTTSVSREQLALAAHDGVLGGLLGGLDAFHDIGGRTDGRTFLVGGGARSRAYRQRAADLLSKPVVVPFTDETVATGAAVQAAVIAGVGSYDEIAGRWRLGAGQTIDPAHDAGAVREAYRLRAAAATS